jgi:hypothetical protein
MVAMNRTWVDIGLNEMLSIEDGGIDGPYFILWPLGPGPHYGNVYPVVIRESSTGRWRATVPRIPQMSVEADSYERVKEKLAQQVKEYLRRRMAFIRAAEPLVSTYIATDEQPHGESSAVIKGRELPVSQVIADMGEAFTASSVGDDSLMIDPSRITATAERLDLPSEIVRAAVAYYLQNMSTVRDEIVRDRRSRLDTAFSRLEAASGLSGEELSHALNGVVEDHD